MKELIFAFRSRSEAFRFYDTLLTYRISVKLINTPSSAGVGCGMSVKLFEKDIRRARMVLERGNFDSYIGTFTFNTFGKAVRI